MKSMKKILFSIIMLTLVFGAILSSSAFAAGNEVKLLDSTITKGSYGFVGFRGDIEVENLGPTKTVQVHYTTDNVNWYNTYASYVGPTGSTHEKWSFSISTNAFTTDHAELKGMSFIKFALRYDVNGSTYWDNNGSLDYYNTFPFAGTISTILGKPNVLNSFGYATSGGSFYGKINVKNLAPTKVVKVLYTTNNWATTQTGYATFGAFINYANEVEYWDFNFSVSGTSVKYKIEYTVGGSTYIDDNYGYNYTATVI
ncbi:hypothetical protein PAECIP111893_03107 [Paenibacillus plantiphilus]|uniref:CBM21 domain-containing protein n=1 Tax=Paenibacillus plantiphilus TaxID=2905650 RepID=A0ABM9CES6_9BACL|nr:CBM21 domain-containing protein [Paenibacillus plantiphilus]CAH1209723.1 hypothetical protein PAECIP111893_03107 [Paenibacillus plantiphilus]